MNCRIRFIVLQTFLATLTSYRKNTAAILPQCRMQVISPGAGIKESIMNMLKVVGLFTVMALSTSVIGSAVSASELDMQSIRQSMSNDAKQTIKSLNKDAQRDLKNSVQLDLSVPVSTDMAMQQAANQKAPQLASVPASRAL